MPPVGFEFKKGKRLSRTYYPYRLQRRGTSEPHDIYNAGLGPREGECTEQLGLQLPTPPPSQYHNVTYVELPIDKHPRESILPLHSMFKTTRPTTVPFSMPSYTLIRQND